MMMKLAIIEFTLAIKASTVLFAHALKTVELVDALGAGAHARIRLAFVY
jgi:hypothetical protein